MKTKCSLAIGSKCAKTCVLQKGTYDCSVCMEKKGPKTAAKLPCGHHFCKPCIDKWSKRETSCPLCRKAYSSYRYRGKVVKTKRKTQRKDELMQVVVIATTDFLEYKEYRECLREEIVQKKPGIDLLMKCIQRSLQILSEPGNRERFANIDLAQALATAGELVGLTEE